MRESISKAFRAWMVLFAAVLGSIGVAQNANAQSEETPPTIEEFGSWTVSCTKNTIYLYEFCNTYHNETLSSGGSDIFVRFGVARALGHEHAGLRILGSFAAGSEIVISVDGEQSWKFAATGDKGMMADQEQSKEIIDRLLAGKSVRVQYTPDGLAPQQMDVSLEKFPEALKHAREKSN